MSVSDDSDIPKVKVVWGDDEWEIYGEILKNRTSKKLLDVLNEGVPYIKNDLAKLAGIDFNKVNYHLKKFKSLGILTEGTKIITKGGIPHATFTNEIIFVGTFINKMGATTVDDNLLRKIFKDGVKFASIGIASIFSWVMIKPKEMIDDKINPETITGIDVIVEYTNFIDISQTNETVILSIVVPILVISLGLNIERILSKLWNKKKKRG